ncbi:hypothetical protein [Micromonospora sp. RTP1Z1]|uniref:hypothetical protein n=1 Tax=Micromonospora sp. RTP1Z1 TaxID=2994043 RepID=UPI0029C78F23|nr:hypothetical protein [Micromonospora sp. RTP1Z1]
MGDTLLEWRPRVTHEFPAVDLSAAEKAAADLLAALGQTIDSDEPVLLGDKRAEIDSLQKMLALL